ncbi:hypothetical protein ACFL1W_00640 [Candidatus Margulisiibacteriota bacterium]
MTVAHILNVCAIAFEIAATLLSVKIAVEKKKVHGWYLAIGFSIWAFADIIKFIPNFQQRVCLILPNNLLSSMFFVAALSILCGVWGFYKEG